MSIVRKVVVQSYVATKKGKLEAGRLRECKTVDQAKRLADSLVLTSAAAGAAVIIQDVEDSDEFAFAEDPILVGYSGRVPAEVEAAL